MEDKGSDVASWTFTVKDEKLRMSKQITKIIGNYYFKTKILLLLLVGTSIVHSIIVY